MQPVFTNVRHVGLLVPEETCPPTEERLLEPHDLGSIEPVEEETVDYTEQSSNSAAEPPFTCGPCRINISRPQNALLMPYPANAKLDSLPMPSICAKVPSALMRPSMQSYQHIRK